MDHAGELETSSPTGEIHHELVERRRPRWTIWIVAGLAAVGSVLAIRSSPTGDREQVLPEAAGRADSTPSSAVSVPDAADDAGFELLGSASQPGRTITFVRVPRNRLGAGTSEIHTLRDGVVTVRNVDEELTSFGRLATFYDQPGQRREYILATTEGTIVTAAGRADLIPYDPTAAPRTLGEGFAALPGPGQSIWLFTSAERVARLVDPGSGREELRVRLDDLGRVIDTAGDGLIIRTPAPWFVYWTPEAVVPLVGVGDTVYLGASDSVAVFADSDALQIVDLSDPTQPPRTVQHGGLDAYRTVVSPDGRHLAASIVSPITEPNPIVIIDLADGSEVDRIDEAVEALFQWASPGRLLFLRPEWPAVDLAERDIETGVDANLLALDDLTWWYTAIENVDREDAE